MKEIIKKKNILRTIIKIIPLFGLFLTWFDNELITRNGVYYFTQNDISSSFGLIIILCSVFLLLKSKYNLLLSIAGNLLLWTPLFYSFFYGPKLKFIQNGFYICLALVVVSIITQALMYRYVSENL